jgi:mycobactin lysine-N-oxygenase
MVSFTQAQTLLVIGAGPKAISLAAKRSVLSSMGLPVPQLRIVDRQGIVAHWSGHFGFTDGRQLLGTRPEKDIGYPYASTSWVDSTLNKAIDNEMLRMSWQSYLINEGKYLDWIDRGRTRPTHHEWSDYLQWVAKQAGIDMIQAEVHEISLSADQKRWQLSCRSALDGTPVLLEGDGLVITGPGTPITLAGQPTNHPRVFDGGSYWQNVATFAHLRDTTTAPLHIGVIGTGETAAAIVTSLVHTLDDAAFIEVISPYGVLYSRDEGFEENRLFSDPDATLARLGGHQHVLSWLSMTENDRREFVRRTDRGVFSVHAMEEVNRAENVRSIMGTVRKMQASDEQVFVDMEYDGTTERDQYDYGIVAIGFNALWFTTLFDEPTRVRLGEVTQSLDRRAIEHSITEDLSIRNFTPRLHLPMLAGIAQGPGFPNLSCLGLLSDRILCSYIPIATSNS